MIIDLIKIICWNCRGVSKRDTTTQIIHMLTKIKDLILCLVETRADNDCLGRFHDNLGRNWKWDAKEA